MLSVIDLKFKKDEIETAEAELFGHKLFIHYDVHQEQYWVNYIDEMFAYETQKLTYTETNRLLSIEEKKEFLKYFIKY